MDKIFLIIKIKPNINVKVRIKAIFELFCKKITNSPNGKKLISLSSVKTLSGLDIAEINTGTIDRPNTSKKIEIINTGSKNYKLISNFLSSNNFATLKNFINI